MAIHHSHAHDCISCFYLFLLPGKKVITPDYNSDNEYFHKIRANKNKGLILLSVLLLAVGAAWIGSSDFLDMNNTPCIITTIIIGFTIASIPVLFKSGNQGRQGVES